MVMVRMAVPWRLLGQKAAIAYGGLRSVAGSGTQTPAKEAHGCHATFAAAGDLPSPASSATPDAHPATVGSTYGLGSCCLAPGC